MKRLFVLLAAFLCATTFAATNDSSQWQDIFQCAGPNYPTFIVPSKCSYQNPAGCQFSYAGTQGTFMMNRLDFTEQNAAQNNLEPTGSLAIPSQTTGECQTADGHYCYRLQATILSHTDPVTDGLTNEEIAANYEWSRGAVRWGAYGGIDIGQQADNITWFTPYSHSGRTIIDAYYTCWVGGVQELLMRSFQVDWTNWTQPPSAR